MTREKRGTSILTVPTRGGSLIRLDDAAIDKALPLVGNGLKTYCRIQGTLWTTDVSCDPQFQRLFNGFYRVRRNATWREAFYRLLEEQKGRL